MPIIARFKRQAFRMTVQSLQYRDGVLTKKSLVTFTFEPGRMSAALAQKLLADAARYGGKLGMRIGKSQRIRSLEAAGLKLAESAELSREFHRAFGAAPGERWVGFAIPGRPALLQGPFLTVLRITFRARPRTAFQLVPVVVAFGNQKLERHYVLGVSVLKASRPTVDSLIEVVASR